MLVGRDLRLTGPQCAGRAAPIPAGTGPKKSSDDRHEQTQQGATKWVHHKFKAHCGASRLGCGPRHSVKWIPLMRVIGCSILPASSWSTSRVLPSGRVGVLTYGAASRCEGAPPNGYSQGCSQMGCSGRQQLSDLVLLEMQRIPVHLRHSLPGHGPFLASRFAPWSRNFNSWRRDRCARDPCRRGGLQEEDVLQVVEDRRPPPRQRTLAIQELAGRFEYAIEWHHMTVRIVWGTLAASVCCVNWWLPRNHLAVSPIQQ